MRAPPFGGGGARPRRALQDPALGPRACCTQVRERRQTPGGKFFWELGGLPGPTWRTAPSGSLQGVRGPPRSSFFPTSSPRASRRRWKLSAHSYGAQARLSTELRAASEGEHCCGRGPPSRLKFLHPQESPASPRGGSCCLSFCRKANSWSRGKRACGTAGRRGVSLRSTGQPADVCRGGAPEACRHREASQSPSPSWWERICCRHEWVLRPWNAPRVPEGQGSSERPHRRRFFLQLTAALLHVLPTARRSAFVDCQLQHLHHSSHTGAGLRQPPRSALLWCAEQNCPALEPPESGPAGPSSCRGPRLTGQPPRWWRCARRFKGGCGGRLPPATAATPTGC